MPFVIPTTGGRTFGDLQTEVLNYGFSDGPQVNRGRVKTWINEGQHRIARKIEAPEFEQVTTITTAGGTVSYALPTDFLRVLTITDQGVQSNPGYVARLRPVDLVAFDQQPSGAVGHPVMYTVFQNNLLLFPTPDQAYSLTVRYILDPPAMIADTDVPVLSADYTDLLVTYACYRAFTAEDDYEAAQFFLSQWQRELGDYASDVQVQEVDRPRQVDGTWVGSTYGTGFGSSR